MGGKSAVVSVIVTGAVDGLKKAFAEGEKATEGFGSKVASIATKGLAIGGAAAAGAFAYGFTQGINRDAMQDNLAGALNLGEADAAKAGSAAADVYANNFGGSLEEAFAGIETVASTFGGVASMTEEQLEGLTSTALTMADVFKIDMTQATTTAGVALTSGLARDAEHAMDLTTRALQKVPAAMRGDLLDSITEYGPMLDQLGFDGEEAFGMLAAAAAKGPFEVDKLGDALKEFTIRATDMSTASVDAYKAIGLNAEDMSSAILAGGDTAKEAFDKIVAGIEGIEDPATQANTAIALFGTPLEDLGTGAIPDFLAGLRDTQDSLGDVGGAADALKDQVGNNLAARFETLKRKALMGLTDAASKAIPYVEKLADWLGVQVPIAIDAMEPKVRSAFTWVKQNVVPVLQDIGRFVVNDVVPALQSFGTKALEISGWLAQHKEVLAGIATAYLVTLVPSIYASVTAAYAKAAAWLAAAAAMVAANAPLIAIAAAIGALVAGVIWAYQNVDWFRTSIDKMADALSWVWGSVLKPVASWLGDNWVKALEIAGRVMVGVMTGGMSEVALFIYRNWDEIIAFIKGVPGKISGAVGSFAQAGMDLGKGVLQGIVDGVAEFTGFVADFAKGLGNAIIDLFNEKVIGWINEKIPDKIAIDFAPDINLPDNPIPRIPRLAAGGIGLARAGGSLVNIAEAGHDEAVIPLPHNWRTNGIGGNTINVNVNNPRATPSEITREIAWAAKTRSF
jgi:hypothetical protein